MELGLVVIRDKYEFAEVEKLSIKIKAVNILGIRSSLVFSKPSLLVAYIDGNWIKSFEVDIDELKLIEWGNMNNE